MVGQQQELSLEQLGSWLGYADDSIIEQVLARFLCSRNKEVEEFLHSSAIAFEKSSSARTYLLATENKDIAGYYPRTQPYRDRRVIVFPVKLMNDYPSMVQQAERLYAEWKENQ